MDESLDLKNLLGNFSSMRNFKFLLDLAKDYFPIVIGVIYIAGYMVTASRLAKYGISSTGLIEAQYLVAGLLPGLLFLLTFYVLILSLSYDINNLNKPNFLKKENLSIENILFFIIYLFFLIVIFIVKDPIYLEKLIQDFFKNNFFQLIIYTLIGESGLWMVAIIIRYFLILIFGEIKNKLMYDKISNEIKHHFDLKTQLEGIRQVSKINNYIDSTFKRIIQLLVFILAIPFYVLFIGIFIMVIFFPMSVLHSAFNNSLSFYENIPQAYGGAKPLEVQFYVDSEKIPADLLDGNFSANQNSPAFTVPVLLLFQTSSEFIVARKEDGNTRAWVLKADAVFVMVEKKDI